MIAYFIRRLLLVPVTFFGITLMIYCILRLAPGNPVETELAAAQAVAGEGSGGGGGGMEGGTAVSPLQVALLQERYQTDKGMFEGYFGWLGLWPQELKRTSEAFGEGQARVEVPVWGTARMAKISRQGNELSQAVFADTGESILADWKVRIETPEQLGKSWRKAVAEADSPLPKGYALPRGGI